MARILKILLDCIWCWIGYGTKCGKFVKEDYWAYEGVSAGWGWVWEMCVWVLERLREEEKGKQEGSNMMVWIIYTIIMKINILQYTIREEMTHIFLAKVDGNTFLRECIKGPILVGLNELYLVSNYFLSCALGLYGSPYIKWLIRLFQLVSPTFSSLPSSSWYCFWLYIFFLGTILCL